MRILGFKTSDIAKFLTVAVVGTLVILSGGPASVQKTPREEASEVAQIAYKAHEVSLQILKGAQSSLCAELPTIEWNPRFQGDTGYIDQVKFGDLGSHSAACGVDGWGREFIAFRYKCTVECDEGSKEDSYGAGTLFQRYTNDFRTIVDAGHFHPEGCRKGPGPLDFRSPSFLTDMDHFFAGRPLYSKNLEGCTRTIELCNEDNCPTPQARIGY